MEIKETSRNGWLSGPRSPWARTEGVCGRESVTRRVDQAEGVGWTLLLPRCWGADALIAVERRLDLVKKGELRGMSVPTNEGEGRGRPTGHEQRTR